MHEKRSALDQGEIAILISEASDEKLEAAAAGIAETPAYSFSFCTSAYVCPWS